MEERMVAGAAYAAFDCVGPLSEEMRETRRCALVEWLPNSGYEWAPKADIELFLGPNLRADDYHSQVWLPIERCRG
jgi:AraC family transcriptional regulator